MEAWIFNGSIYEKKLRRHVFMSVRARWIRDEVRSGRENKKDVHSVSGISSPARRASQARKAFGRIPYASSLRRAHARARARIPKKRA
jgi:hypothetical protein